ncbi:putative hydrolase or acyltransferase of alpha/beta superfamily precursor [Bosea sp. LC85]|uniref:alpha/beta fold hydrolase n=1 Tax=Bosea sp. LC85 TaxID=1502851 RepID=UPI0004E41DA2|nr:alpha/beta hydrolase [Bosea sp. LC85]KFC70334.1 putative hydrolase or acyltransferase of alpha/beta superfamily precursor [Bosea sp. LC85]
MSTAQPVAPVLSQSFAVRYGTAEVQGLEIFYREAGPRDAPAILLLHGFPSSSHMFRDLLPLLAKGYRVVAPDYPGFGHSSAPSPSEFTYSFDGLAEVIDGFAEQVGLTRYALYIQDYGGPVGFRLALKHPERIRALIIQNAVASEGAWSTDVRRDMEPFWRNWTPETEKPFRDLLTAGGTKFQYTHGATRLERLSPDAWRHDQAGLDRPGNQDIQLRLLHDYQSNFAAYPAWQAYLARHQPPALIVWGKSDPFFMLAGVDYLKEQLPAAEVHLFDAGHFALETHSGEIAERVDTFMKRLPRVD